MTSIGDAFSILRACLPEPLAAPLRQFRSGHDLVQLYRYLHRETPSLLEDLAGIDGRRPYAERMVDIVITWAFKADRVAFCESIPPAVHLLPAALTDGVRLFNWSADELARLIEIADLEPEADVIASVLTQLVHECVASIAGASTLLESSNNEEFALQLELLANAVGAELVFGSTEERMNFYVRDVDPRKLR